VCADGALRQAESPGDLGVGQPARDQVQQLPVPRGELGDGVAAAFGIEVGLVQVWPQQREQGAVGLGEVGTGPPEEEQPQGPAGAGGLTAPGRQGQHQLVLNALWLVEVAVHAGAVPLAGRIEVRDLDDAAQVAGAVGITAGLAVPVVHPVRLRVSLVRSVVLDRE